MMEGIHKLFSKRSRVRKYGYEREYEDIDDMEDEDIFSDEKEQYVGDEYDVEDEYFD